ncbi:MAG: hypothetical protein JNK14_00700 [Chitinophagaceae bacterium]|nr:hypothetical protein [Chitinophagaceae bacterium]
MKFIGKDGQEVELKILGYQFPTSFDNEWDANWLRIYLNVKSNVGYWQTVDPSLTTWEVDQIIKWFSALSQNQEVEHLEMTFIEPNLSFQFLDKTSDTKTIQIKFNLESRPQPADDDKEYFINFHFFNKDLATIANELSIEHSKFPVRPFSATSVAEKVESDKKPWWKFW